MVTITTSSNTVNWAMDSQGNWTNRNGVTQTHNSENQITSGGMTYDGNSNTTTDDRGYTLKYEAWQGGDAGDAGRCESGVGSCGFS